MDDASIDFTGVQVVGADLDLTLIDTREATAFALHEMNSSIGATVDVDAFVARLGPPIRAELARSISEDRLDDAVAAFRRSFLDGGLRHLKPLPGAARLTQAVKDRDGDLIVITSRIPPIAQACLEACGLEPSVVVGGVTGEEKAPAMIEHRLDVYLGDHPLDMIGARAAGVLAIGVTTGAHADSELRRAGAAAVAPNLDVVTDWLIAAG